MAYKYVYIFIYLFIINIFNYLLLFFFFFTCRIFKLLYFSTNDKKYILLNLDVEIKIKTRLKSMKSL